MPYIAYEDTPRDMSKEYARLRAKIDAALQRLSESGTGEMGLLDTIHATHAILKD